MIQTLDHREGILIKKINSYVLITGIIIVLFLFYFLLKIRRSILNDECSDKYKGGYTTAKITSIITILFLITFQYSFYKLSLSYLYTVSGLNMCNDRDIQHFINIMKIKENKTYTEEAAFKYILKNSLKTKDKKVKISFSSSVNDCLNNGGRFKNNVCTREFSTCHYLKKDFEKYGNGDNELEYEL